MATLDDLYTLISEALSDNNKISDGTVRIPYQELTYVIPAGGRQDVFITFNYFRVLSLNVNTLSIILGQNGLLTPFSGQGVGVDFKETFGRITLVNTGGAPMTITAAFADGSVNDDRLNVSSTVTVAGTVSTRPQATTHTYNGAVSISNAATQISAAVATRYRGIIRAGASDLWIGATSGVTATGEPTIYAGDSLEIWHVGAIFGIRAAGTGVNAGYYEETI